MNPTTATHPDKNRKHKHTHQLSFCLFFSFFFYITVQWREVGNSARTALMHNMSIVKNSLRVKVSITVPRDRHMVFMPRSRKMRGLQSCAFTFPTAINHNVATAHVAS